PWRPNFWTHTQGSVRRTTPGVLWATDGAIRRGEPRVRYGRIALSFSGPWTALYAAGDPGFWTSRPPPRSQGGRRRYMPPGTQGSDGPAPLTPRPSPGSCATPSPRSAPEAPAPPSACSPTDRWLG